MMFSKIRKFSRLTIEEKKLFLEAYFTLGMMRVGIIVFSFKRLTSSLIQEPQEESLQVLSDEDKHTANNIGAAIIRAANHTPWESACLAQSLTASRMLRKRAIPGLLYIGVLKDKESPGMIQAHAWTKCAETTITGETGDQGYTILSYFGWQ